MRRRAATLQQLILAVLLTVPATLTAATGPEWKLITDRRGIQVFVGTDKHARLKTFRGVTTMSLRDEYSMLALYNDIDAFPRWLHMIDGAELIDERSPLDRDLRFTIDLPWPVADREAVLTSKLVHVTRPGNETVTAHLLGDSSLTEPKNGYVRMQALKGQFSFRRLAPGTVQAIFELSMDMGGFLPQWVVDFTLRDVPYFSLEKMRRLVALEQYQGHYYPYLQLIGPGRPADAPPVKSWVYGTGLNQADTSDRDAARSRR